MSKIGNFLSHYSPTGPRLNRAKYIQYTVLFIILIFVMAWIIGVAALVISGDDMYQSILQNYTKPIAGLLVGFMFVSLGIRRNHDVGISGWWILLSFIFNFFYPLAFCFIPGTKGPNKYGPDPLQKLPTKN